MHNHLVFFDSECPFCDRSVRHILEIDVDQQFLFAPLNGETASTILTGPQKSLKNANSIVLVQNFDSTDRYFWVRSKAIFKIYWLIGHGWGLIGILSFFPCVISDFIYRWFAAHRHQFKLKMSQKGIPKERLLP